MQLMDWLSGKAFGGQMDERNVRMANEIAQQFASGIACGSNDRDSYHNGFLASNNITISPKGGVAKSLSCRPRAVPRRYSS